MSDQTHRPEALHVIALLAAARTALGAARQIATRRSGRDPSAQEPEGLVRADLRDLRAGAGEVVVRLRLRAIVGPPEPSDAALAQSFEDRLLFDDLARLARQVHQKLLSLYPAVDVDVVEEARRLTLDAEHAAIADDVESYLGSLGRRAAAWVDALDEALAAG